VLTTSIKHLWVSLLVLPAFPTVVFWALHVCSRRTKLIRSSSQVVLSLLFPTLLSREFVSHIRVWDLVEKFSIDLPLQIQDIRSQSGFVLMNLISSRTLPTFFKYINKRPMNTEQ
jgi:hypothetical protein